MPTRTGPVAVVTTEALLAAHQQHDDKRFDDLGVKVDALVAATSKQTKVLSLVIAMAAVVGAFLHGLVFGG